MKALLDYVSTVTDMRQEKKILHKMMDIIMLVFFAMVPSEFLENFQKQWNEMLNSGEGNKIKRLLAIDGKTQRGNGGKNQKANHIVSVVDEEGFCLGQKRADYVLALKANQGNLLEDVRLYFSEDEFLKKCAYKKTVEKARGKTEKREYWQTDDISWINQKKEWEGLRSHWMVESYYWHLDVTFREDGNHTL